MIFEQVNVPEDVKQLNEAQLITLCEELRSFLIEKVSHSGGHLASNLGVVELTVAIHRVFDTAQDRLVFDVGHQCYVHKALTGRKALFDTLRQLDGISGFPKPYESNHDAFVAGHASNSVSVALGMARARTLLHQNYNVIALIGDGALGGGLSFEGLNDAGDSGEPLIVILNDNGMSIQPIVGAVAGHLRSLRNKRGYYEFKKQYRRALSATTLGRRLYQISHSTKTLLKKTILPASSMFEDMGFTYMGPVDGHDVVQLTQALQQARELQCPVLLHVHSVKGHGYQFAEEDPGRYHGIGPFDTATGKCLKEEFPTFSSIFGDYLSELAEKDKRICGITAAMMEGTGLQTFAKAYPNRYFDVGIAEGHAVSMAGGMAKQGLKPVFAVYSSFLQRGYDELLQDVALDKLHVIFAVDRAGIVGADGETHHGVFDPLYLSQVPGMTVLCPSSFGELRSMLYRAIYEFDGPVAVRYPRGSEGKYSQVCGNENFTELRQGNDGTILSYGILINNALAAADLLQQRGIEVRVVKLNCIAPLDNAIVNQALLNENRLLVVEDCMGTGCIGQRIAAIMAQQEQSPKQLVLKNLGGIIAPQGTINELYHAFGLDAEGIANAMEEAIHEQ